MPTCKSNSSSLLCVSYPFCSSVAEAKSGNGRYKIVVTYKDIKETQIDRVTIILEEGEVKIRMDRYARFALC